MHLKNSFAGTLSVRAMLISLAAVCGAVAWGAAEIIALQWSRLGDKLRAHDNSRAF